MARPNHTQSLTGWGWLREFPPIIVRLSARFAVAGKNVRAPSHREVAISAGIPLARVMAISESFSWDNITVKEAERFCAACGFDPTNARDRRRQITYIRSCQTKHPGRPPHYLQCSPFWPTEFLPLIQRLKSQPTSSVESQKSPSAVTRSAA